MTTTVTDVLNAMAQRFTSGNSVPVERAHITRDEWDAVVSELMGGATGPKAKAAAEPNKAVQAGAEDCQVGSAAEPRHRYDINSIPSPSAICALIGCKNRQVHVHDVREPAEPR